MLDPKINHSTSDVGRLRSDTARTDPLSRDRRDPEKRKDFRKLLDDDAPAETAEKEGPVRKARDRSIFDPQSKSGTKETPAQMPLIQESRQDISGFAPAEKPNSARTQGGDESAYSDAGADLGSNPNTSGYILGQAKAFDVGAAEGDQGAQVSRPVQQIVDQIVDKIYTLKVDGKTETVLVLKHPPVLAGAELALTAYDHARGEFNIAIHNLTQAAQAFLEQHNVRLGLKQALEDRGYTVHVVATTTEAFQPTAAAEAAEGSEKGRRDQEEQGQQEREKQRRGRS